MRKIFLYAGLYMVLFIFGSCSTTFRNSSVVLIDYSNYSSENFFITESNCVNFEYIPIGSIIVKDNFNSDIDAIFRNFIIKCKEKGANGIINLNYYISPYEEKSGGNYIIKGMAIKRK